MERINEIKIDDVVPEVLREDYADASSSDGLWMTSLRYTRGHTYRLSATSGRGKTSLCSFLYGVRNDYLGDIFFNDSNIRRFRIRDWCEVRRRHLAYVPQELDVFAELTALDNVLIKNRLTDFYSEAEIREMFAMLEIDHRIDFPAGRMSVGQRQRLALIRAVCQPFDFLILDEPVSHLDETSNRLCADLIAREAARRDAGVIFTSVGYDLEIAQA